MADLDYEGFWKETLIQLRNDLGGEEFSGWFSGLKYLHAQYDEQAGVDYIVIGVPSAFHRDKVSSRYRGVISSTLKKLSGKEIHLELEVSDTVKSEQIKTEPVIKISQPKKEEEAPAKTTKIKEKRSQHHQLRDDYTFDRYVIGNNNNFPANAALAISKNPGKAHNPFLIYGGVGLGKTHLMQAIGNYVHENTDNEVIYITSENFLNEYLDGLKPQEHGQNTMKSFKNKYRYTDVLLIDDIQFFTDKPGVQEELFHTFNALIDAKKQIVFTCDRPITELKKFSERLISRVGSGIKADLQPPRYEERCAILKKTAESKNIDISNEVIDFVSNNISSNVRDLIGAFETLIAYTQLMGKPITLEIAQQRLKNEFDISKYDFPMDNIIRVAADKFSLTPNDLKGKKRTQNVVFARQLAMYIGRKMTDYSTTEIGQDFGGRDHTTVMHSINKIEEKLITDPALEAVIEELKRSIKEFSAKY